MNDIVCPIWVTNATLSDSNGDYKVFDSPRAGGMYKITRSALNQVTDLKPKEATRITNWLVDQRQSGVNTPIITSEIINTLKTYRLFNVSEMLERTLIWLADNVGGLGKQIPLGTQIPNYMGFEFLASTTQHLSAASGSIATHEVVELLEFAVEEGLVVSNPDRKKNDGGFFSLTYKGYKRVEELNTVKAVGQNVFVAMWFSKLLDDVYSKGFASAIQDAGYLPIRIDRKEHNNKIDDEIVVEIRRSKFVVADFTSEVVDRQSAEGDSFKDTHARGGVYFEAGFAKGLGKEVIWTVREDVLPFVHFDTRQFAHIVWKDIDDLRTQLSRRISATMGDGPNKKPT